MYSYIMKRQKVVPYANKRKKSSKKRERIAARIAHGKYSTTPHYYLFQFLQRLDQVLPHSLISFITILVPFHSLSSKYFTNTVLT